MDPCGSAASPKEHDLVGRESGAIIQQLIGSHWYRQIITGTATNQGIVNQIGTSFRWIDRFTLPEACTGDLNGDLSVDAADLAELLGAWGTAAKGADLDGNGQVDAADLAVLLGVWGPC